MNDFPNYVQVLRRLVYSFYTPSTVSKASRDSVEAESGRATFGRCWCLHVSFTVASTLPARGISLCRGSTI